MQRELPISGPATTEILTKTKEKMDKDNEVKVYKWEERPTKFSLIDEIVILVGGGALMAALAYAAIFGN